MKISKTIQLKAVFLLAVFTLNTLVGFACAVSLNIGFHSKQHHHKEGTAHHHEDAEQKNNCCNDEAIQFSQLDKLLEKTVDTGIETPVVLIYRLDQTDLYSFIQEKELVSSSGKPFVSTARGIRVSIQSFQI